MNEGTASPPATATTSAASCRTRRSSRVWRARLCSSMSGRLRTRCANCVRPRTPRASYAPSSHCRASCGPPTSTRTMGAWTMPPRSAGRGTFSTMNRPRAAVGRQHAGAIPLTTFLTVINGSYGEKRVPSDARHDARGSTAGVVAQGDATTFRHGRAPALDKPPRRSGSARGQTVTSPPWDSSVA